MRRTARYRIRMETRAAAATTASFPKREDRKHAAGRPLRQKADEGAEEEGATGADRWLRSSTLSLKGRQFATSRIVSTLLRGHVQFTPRVEC